MGPAPADPHSVTHPCRPTASMMRVTLFHPAFGPIGGAEVLVTRHAALLRSTGYEVEIVTRSLDRALWQPWIDANDTKVHDVPRTWWERKLYRAPPRWLHGSARYVAPYLDDSACVVAYNAPPPALIGPIRQLRPRSVWHCNEPARELHFVETTRATIAHLPAPGRTSGTTLRGVTWAAEKLAAYERRLAERWRFALDRVLDVERVGRLDRIIALSAYTAESVRLVYGRTVDAIVPPVIPEPQAVRRRSGIDRAGGGLHVLAHARLEAMKNIDAVLRGFARFRARVPGAHVLHVVGTGVFGDPLREVAAELGLGDAVRWHGYLPDAALAEVYARCDVLALLPFDEPFGMVFPEAALQGLLLIGSDHGGPAEILDGGALGWAVDAFEPDAITDALDEVWRLPDGEADRRRTEAAAACRARYSMAAVRPQLVAALLG